jgi:hypothetical protein
MHALNPECLIYYIVYIQEFSISVLNPGNHAAGNHRA